MWTRAERGITFTLRIIAIIAPLEDCYKGSNDVTMENEHAVGRRHSSFSNQERDTQYHVGRRSSIMPLSQTESELDSSRLTCPLSNLEHMEGQHSSLVFRPRTGVPQLRIFLETLNDLNTTSHYSAPCPNSCPRHLLTSVQQQSSNSEMRST